MRYNSEEILKLKKPTNGFLCSLEANEYDLEFLAFKISDYGSKKTLFEIGSSVKPLEMEFDTMEDFDPSDEDSFRRVKYCFSEDVLKLPMIATSLTFQVGTEKPVPNFRMIERHYFCDQLIKSYDFNFGFCIPGSTNTWDAVYDVPPLDDVLVKQMIENPFATTSDSFYFINDELIMHNKASYRYTPSS